LVAASFSRGTRLGHSACAGLLVWVWLGTEGIEHTDAGCYAVQGLPCQFCVAAAAAEDRFFLFKTQKTDLAAGVFFFLA
jgi:hypothetical protein